MRNFNRSSKKIVSKDEVTELLSIFDEYQNILLKLDHLELRAQKITGEINELGEDETFGFTMDFLNGSYKYENLFELLSVEVPFSAIGL